MTMTNVKDQIKDMLDVTVVAFQMDDRHAMYFDCVDDETNTLLESKYEADTGRVSYREEGFEDWQTADYIF